MSTTWSIISLNKHSLLLWNANETLIIVGEHLSSDKVKIEQKVTGVSEDYKVLTKLFWNYDEGPKNIENINIFIKNDYLVLERGNLYHSLYDLKLTED